MSKKKKVGPFDMFLDDLSPEEQNILNSALQSRLMVREQTSSEKITNHPSFNELQGLCDDIGAFETKVPVNGFAEVVINGDFDGEVTWYINDHDIDSPTNKNPVLSKVIKDMKERIKKANVIAKKIANDLDIDVQCVYDECDLY